MTTRRSWSALTLGAAGTVAAVLAATVGVPPAAAATEVPMTSRLRSCDFTASTYVAAVGYGRGVGQVSVDGKQVTANFVLVTAVPNTYYNVRVIQTPRPSIGCGPGAPGVTSGGFLTDDVGAGGVSLVVPAAAGTGCWLIIERPSEYTQTPAEFYTSDFIVPI